MGAKASIGDRTIPSDNDIEKLEQKIKEYCDQNKQKIKNMFDLEFFSEENIEFNIEKSDQIKKIDNGKMLTDFVIQWSIPGKMNSTNCRLTFFNLGSFLGANGFLFSICTFYSYFLRIEKEPKTKAEKETIILNCLNYIDNKDKDKLKEIWKVDINDDILKTLRIAKNFLINNIYMSKEEIGKDICNLIEDKFYGKLDKCKNFFKKIWIHLIYFFQKNYKQKEADYVHFKNSINKKKIFEKIDSLLRNLEKFKKYNIFILATDDNTKREKNSFSTFMGYYCEGLGEKRKARRLDSEATDGFILPQDQLVYEYYWQIIYDIQGFIERNKERIDNINKGINIDLNFSEIIKDIDENGTRDNSFNNDYSENGLEENDDLKEKLIMH